MRIFVDGVISIYNFKNSGFVFIMGMRLLFLYFHDYLKGLLLQNLKSHLSKIFLKCKGSNMF